MKYCHGTFSGYKATLCAEEITVVGHRCTIHGRLPDDSRVAKIINWGPCRDISDVRAFLGTIGVARMFIRNFVHRTHALTRLTRKDQPFVFGLNRSRHKRTSNKRSLTPCASPINYSSSSPVIFAVDTSYIAVGYHLCHATLTIPKSDTMRASAL